MRLNTPVIDREHVWPHSRALVSMTDLKGRIVYCNRAFVEVCGYSATELLGQPHNIIRHPDVPAEAFRDLWDTVALGRPWSGVVKNRRKDGSYYWVVANVTPVLEGEVPIGYMSVRTPASRDAIRQAEALYAMLREEAASGQERHRLEAGQLVRTGWQGRVRQALRPSLGGRLAATVLLAALLSFWGGTLAARGSGPWAGALGAGVALAAAGLAGWRLRRMVLGPLQRVLAFCNGMAAGRLGRSLDPQGQPLLHDVAVALNQLDVNLRAVVGDVRSESDGLRQATAEMAASNADLSARTDAQAASLQQTAVSMQQIMETVHKSTESARLAAGLAQQANEVTRSGGQAVEALFETMSQVQAASRRIGEIISLIEGIALQTHILSLNAAVEATRGDGRGQGFAAVAAEVRTLAGRTTAAAKEVKALVGELGSTVAAGTTRAGVARTTMEGALQAVVQVAELLQAISSAAQEQFGGVSQVNQAVVQLDGITHHNAAMVQQVANSAVRLREQAQAMADSVKVFHLGAAGESVVASTDAVALRREAKAAARDHAAVPPSRPSGQARSLEPLSP